MVKKQRSPALQPTNRTLVRTPVDGGSLVSWMAVSVIAVLFVCQPVGGERLWWDLSRGREVLRGTLAPCQQLLSCETNREADWLGGVIPFLLFASWGASGLMVFRAATVLLVIGVVIGRRPALPLPLAGGLCGLGLLAVQPALEPVAAAFDTLAMIVVFVLARQWSRRQRFRYGICLLMALLLWANLAAGIAWGFLILATAGWPERPSEVPTAQDAGRGVPIVYRHLLLILFAGILVCLTPRGVYTLSDSAVLLLPRWFEADARLDGSPWRTLAQGPWEWTAWSFAVLSVLAAVVVWRRYTTARLVAFFAIQMIAWSARPSLPLASLWLLLLVADAVRPSSSAAPPNLDTAATPRQLTWTVWGAVALLLLWGMIRGQPLDQLRQQFGWGIDARLDYRFIQLALQDAQPTGTVCCDGVLAAGMVSWLNYPDLVAQDEPQRALLGGRWPDLQRVFEDLHAERMTSYWRDDHTHGGWWLVLEQRQTTLLLVSADNASLIRALEPTIWKPLALDAPVLPYAQAGDTAFQPLLIEILRQRQFVEFGPWIYTASAHTGSAFDRDRWGWRPPRPAWEVTLRQARVFRGMRLHFAALKVLQVARQRWRHRLLEWEFDTCQREMAIQERRLAGRSSVFRQLAAEASSNRLPAEGPHSMDGIRSDSDSDGIPPALTSAVRHYRQGDVASALDALRQSTGDPQTDYALALLLLEQGRIRPARPVLQSLSQRSANTSIELLAGELLKSLE